MPHVPSAKPSRLFRPRGAQPRAVRSGDHQYIARLSAAEKKMSGFLSRTALRWPRPDAPSPGRDGAKRWTGSKFNRLGPVSTRMRHSSLTIERRESMSSGHFELRLECRSWAGRPPISVAEGPLLPKIAVIPLRSHSPCTTTICFHELRRKSSVRLHGSFRGSCWADSCSPRSACSWPSPYERRP
jgi:hypothetical protein